MTTANKSLVQPPFNSTSGTLPDGTPYSSWDVPIDYDLGAIDTALGSTASIVVTALSSPQTLTLAQYQNLNLNFAGTLSGDFIFNVPTGAGGFWFVRNSCTGNFNLSIGYNGSTVVVPKGVQFLVSIDTTTSPYVSLLQVSSFKTYAGNPNGNVPGNAGAPGTSSASVTFDTTNYLAWVCTTSGPASTAVWDFIGSTSFYTVNSPTTIGSNTNNYAPTGFAKTGILRLTASAAVAITGLAGGAGGRYVILENVGTFNITLSNLNSGSTAGNQFNFGFDYVLAPGQSVGVYYDVVSSVWRTVGAPYTMPSFTPGLRLTLTSGVPVMVNDVSGAATVYYTPFVNSMIDLYNGGSWYTVSISELSQALSDTTKSPAATVANNPYDVFVWNDSGTIRATRGPTWLTGGGSTTARGTGAGSTERIRVNGIWTNRFAITNGPGANLGRYVGSFITNGSNQVDWVANPAATSGGGNARLNIWNENNRRPAGATSIDSTATWSGTGTTRAANGSNSNRITVFVGDQEDVVNVTVTVSGTGGANNQAAGIGVNSTTTISGVFSGGHGDTNATQARSGLSAQYTGIPPQVGVNFYQWLDGPVTGSFLGVNSSLTAQSGITGMFQM